MTYYDEETGEWEVTASFVGNCECSHEMEEHTWGSCGVNGCECEAGWEE